MNDFNPNAPAAPQFPPVTGNPMGGAAPAAGGGGMDAALQALAGSETATGGGTPIPEGNYLLALEDFAFDEGLREGKDASPHFKAVFVVVGGGLAAATGRKVWKRFGLKAGQNIAISKREMIALGLPANDMAQMSQVVQSGTYKGLTADCRVKINSGGYNEVNVRQAGRARAVVDQQGNIVAVNNPNPGQAGQLQQGGQVAPQQGQVVQGQPGGFPGGGVANPLG